MSNSQTQLHNETGKSLRYGARLFRFDEKGRKTKIDDGVIFSLLPKLQFIHLKDRTFDGLETCPWASVIYLDNFVNRADRHN